MCPGLGEGNPEPWAAIDHGADQGEKEAQSVTERKVQTFLQFTHTVTLAPCSQGKHILEAGSQEVPIEHHTNKSCTSVILTPTQLAWPFAFSHIGDVGSASRARQTVSPFADAKRGAGYNLTKSKSPSPETQ